jgi:hypothetical protein
MYNLKMNNDMNESKKTTKISKYHIEGGIDFYSEINSNDTKITTTTTLTNSINEPIPVENTCLITGEPLGKYYQTMMCGHSFNYIPLYLYVKQSKYKFNHLEHNPLKLNQIKCPYCRNIQNELLPYIEELDFPKIPGVNFMSEQSTSINGLCEYVNYKKIRCTSTRVYILNGKCYCYTHRNITIRKEYNKQKNKAYKKQNKMIDNNNSTNTLNSVEDHPEITNINDNNNNDNEDDNLLNTDVMNHQDIYIDTTKPPPPPAKEEEDKKEEEQPQEHKLCKYIYVKGIVKGNCCNKPIFNLTDINCKKHKK